MRVRVVRGEYDVGIGRYGERLQRTGGEVVDWSGNARTGCEWGVRSGLMSIGDIGAYWRGEG